MTASWSILVLEDDVWIHELIETVLGSLYPDASVMISTLVEDARDTWRWSEPALVIADWNLPDGSGIDLVRDIRKTHATIPVLMLTARSDWRSVTAAARLGIQGFISKPFEVDTLVERLRSILPPPEAAPEAAEPDLEGLLVEARESGVRLPAAVDPEELAGLLARADNLSSADLVACWEDSPELTARLLNAANAASMRRLGKACDTLQEAVNALGVRSSLAHASALALDVRGALSDADLARRAGEYLTVSESLADGAATLAQQLRADKALCRTAGMLHCLCELAVLTTVQRFLDAGGTLEPHQLEETFAGWSPTLGNRLKVDWRLSLPLRDLIGATHRLEQGHQPLARVLMRAAALIARGERESPECRKLLSRLGVTDGG
ncbi:MAG: response regulator [Halospina sp.]